MNRSAGVAVVSVFVFVTACKEPAVVNPDAGAAPVQTAATPHGAHGGVTSAIAALPMDAVVVVVNAQTFTRKELERTIVQAGALAGIPPESVDASMRDAFEPLAYEKLIERALLGAEARRRGLWPSAEDAKKQREEMIRQLPQGKSLDDVLNALRTDAATFASDVETDIAIGRLLEAEQKELRLPGDDVVARIYEEKKASFATKDTASASHILVKLPLDADPAAVAAARNKAGEIRASVVGKGAAAFAAAAEQHSADPTAKLNHGDVGTFAKGDMLPEFEAAAFQLKEGEVSQPVRTERGLHVLRGQGTTKGRQMPLSEVKSVIIDREQTKAFMDRVDQLVAALRNAAKIERKVEPMPSPLVDANDSGSRVPSWRPSSKNALPGLQNPHGAVPNAP